MLYLGRQAFILFAVLTLIYVCVYYYLREGQKMRLEEDWVMEGRPGDRADWVGERLKPRADRLMRWLIFFVYVLPVTAIAVFVFVTN
ncbi:hypothetical protein HKCCE2091_14000 [Rhodobacterales bacterium HKCCE2091]|nr:hypothetical protein [Rhodobacterales bacterium HKCCE2091]